MVSKKTYPSLLNYFLSRPAPIMTLHQSISLTQQKKVRSSPKLLPNVFLNEGPAIFKTCFTGILSFQTDSSTYCPARRANAQNCLKLKVVPDRAYPAITSVTFQVDSPGKMLWIRYCFGADSICNGSVPNGIYCTLSMRFTNHTCAHSQWQHMRSSRKPTLGNC